MIRSGIEPQKHGIAFDMLNDAKLRAAQPRAKAYKLTDAHQLYLFVTPKGSKLWRMDYGFDRKRKCLSIGPYPLVSLVEAREKRDDARRLLAEGKDPSVVKKLRIQENIESARMTFERVAREWQEANKPQWAEVHAAEVIRTLASSRSATMGRLSIALDRFSWPIWCDVRARPDLPVFASLGSALAVPSSRSEDSVEWRVRA